MSTKVLPREKFCPPQVKGTGFEDKLQCVVFTLFSTYEVLIFVTIYKIAVDINYMYDQFAYLYDNVKFLLLNIHLYQYT